MSKAKPSFVDGFPTLALFRLLYSYFAHFLKQARRNNHERTDQHQRSQL